MTISCLSDSCEQNADVVRFRATCVCVCVCVCPHWHITHANNYLFSTIQETPSLCVQLKHALGVMKIAGDLKLPRLIDRQQIKSKNEEDLKII